MMQKPTTAPSYEAKYLTALWLSTQLMIKVTISLTIWNASLHFKIAFTGKPFLVHNVHSGGQVFHKTRELHITVISQLLATSAQYRNNLGENNTIHKSDFDFLLYNSHITCQFIGNATT
jgi:hypothetical protein